MTEEYRLNFMDEEFKKLVQEMKEAESMYNHAEGHFKDIAYRKYKIAQERVDIEVNRQKLEKR